MVANVCSVNESLCERLRVLATGTTNVLIRNGGTNSISGNKLLLYATADPWNDNTDATDNFKIKLDPTASEIICSRFAGTKGGDQTGDFATFTKGGNVVAQILHTGEYRTAPVAPVAGEPSRAGASQTRPCTTPSRSTSATRVTRTTCRTAR